MLKKITPYLLAAAVAFSPVTYAQQFSEDELQSITLPLTTQPPETPICTEEICPLPQRTCTSEQETQITSLQLTVSLSKYTLLLEGKDENTQENCTLLEEKVIVGSKDWKTPVMETIISKAQTYPFWFPTQKVLEDTKEKDPDLYAAMQFNEEGRAYMPPGPVNPLGKVKFIIESPYYVFMHGSPFRRFFAAEKRAFSHGCIRAEDEVQLLKVLSRVAGSECDEACIDNLIEKKKTKTISFEKPIKIKIVAE